MPRMKHKDVLTAIRAAGYHDDKERGILLYIKNWVSLRKYSREFEAGAEMRLNGPRAIALNAGKARRMRPDGSASQLRLFKSLGT